MTKVFLSSTARDLADHREAAYRAIEGLDGYHCDCMQNWGARDEDAGAFCPERVRKCDLFIGVIGHCYGSRPKRRKLSYTEREYRAAVAAKKPRLVFLAPDDFAVPPELEEPAEKQERQRAFRDRVRGDRMHGSFASPEVLATAVVQAIHHWERGQALPSSKTVTDTCAPLYAHPYLMPEHWTGRQAEMDDLDAWVKEDDRPLCCMIAMGGMGKSSLAWEWVTKRVAPEQQALELEGIFEWSFYEGEVSFERFLERLIGYLGISAEPDPVTAITDHLSQHRLLLILDGFERLLRYYASVDAALLPEKTAEELEDHERQCADLSVARFIRTLAANSATKTLLTTRLSPEELDGAAGCLEMELEGLAPDDAVAYLQANDIKGTPRELRDAAHVYGFHPLSLLRLVNVFHYDTKEPDDIRQASKYEIAAELQARQHHILEQAYNTLPHDVAHFLSALAANRGSVSMQVARLLAEHCDVGDLSSALRRLEQDRWITWDREADTLDFHPLVRRYAYSRLDGKRSVHGRLVEHFFWRIPASEGPIEGIEGLGPVIELYCHMIQARREDQAVLLFADRLGVRLLERFGAYRTTVELLSPLFWHDGNCRLQSISTRQASWLSALLANAYAVCGQPRRSLALYYACSQIDESVGDKLNLAIDLGNTANQHVPIGDLAAAERNLRRRVELCRQMRVGFREAVGRDDLGATLCIKGAFAEAEEQLAAALAGFVTRGQPQCQCAVWMNRCLLALLMGDAEGALDAGRRARELGNEIARTHYTRPRDVLRVEWLLGWSLLALAAEQPDRREEHLAEAETHLNQALTRCRKINNVDLEPDILLTWGRWHHLKGDSEQARAHADEALSIADRCEYRLNQADIHNFLAKLDMEAGNMDAAREHAEIAKERAYCDGPPHYYKPAYEEAERQELEARS